MPTARRRYQVTETQALAWALDRAAQKWPGEPRSKLLLRLVDLGAHTLKEDQRAQSDAHRGAVIASSGAYTGAFPPGYLSELRADWPA